jgi:hypothetical protein
LHKLCLQYYYKRGWYHNTLEIKQLFQKYKDWYGIILNKQDHE